MIDKEEVLIKKAQDLWDKDLYQTTEMRNDRLVTISKLLVFKSVYYFTKMFSKSKHPTVIEALFDLWVIEKLLEEK